jgi:hypothetical protein
MSAPTKFARLPRLANPGFTAGAITIAWERNEPAPYKDLPAAKLWPCRIAMCDSPVGGIANEIVRGALHGLVVRDPRGRLARIVGVEAFATGSHGTGTPLSLLCLTLDESATPFGVAPLYEDEALADEGGRD